MKKHFISRNAGARHERRKPIIGEASVTIVTDFSGMPTMHLALESPGGVERQHRDRWLKDNMGRVFALIPRDSETRRLTFEAQLAILIGMLKAWPAYAREEWGRIAIDELQELLLRDAKAAPR